MRSVILLLLGVQWAFAAWSNGYAYRRTITVNASQVPAAQSGFPMLLCFNGSSGACSDSGLAVSGLKTAANGGSVRNTCAQASPALTVGCDVIFTSDATGASVLQFEWEKYTPSSGESLVWVNIPSLSNGTTVYLFYGNAAVTTFQGNTAAVWDTNYKLVWHLPNGTALSVSDSTSNGNNASNNGATATAGPVDGAAAFNGTNQSTSSSKSVDLSSVKVATFEFWFYPVSMSSCAVLMETSANSNSSAGSMLVDPNCEAGSKWGFEISKGDGASYNGVTVNSYPSTGTWHHIAFTVDLSAGTGQAVNLYVDSSPAAVTQNRNSDLSGVNLGNLTVYFMARNNSQYYQSGSLDEIRVSSSKRSAAWIAAEYNNQSAPAAFYTVGGEQTFTGAGATYLILGTLTRHPFPDIQMERAS